MIKRGAGILWNAESCQGVISLSCGKTSVERSQITHCRLSASTAEKFRISADRKTTVRSRCTTDVQPVLLAVPFFRIVCGLFAKEL